MGEFLALPQTADETGHALPGAVTWVPGLLQQAHGLGRGNGLVVQVACQQYPVHRVGIQQGKNLLQDVFLVLQHGKFVDPHAAGLGRHEMAQLVNGDEHAEHKDGR